MAVALLWSPTSQPPSFLGSMLKVEKLLTRGPQWVLNWALLKRKKDEADGCSIF